MTPFQSRLKSPEEIELQRKGEELAEVQEELAGHEKLYAALKSEIRVFEQVYEEILGSRIEELEDLEWQLKGLLGEASEEVKAETQQHEQLFSHFQHTTDLLDDEDTQSGTANLSLRSLYRGVAKAVHPDLASDEEDRCRRQELMAVANEAYQSGNRQVLADLLSEWDQAVSDDSGVNVAMELVRVIRQIALVRQNVHAVIRLMDELRKSDLYCFKLRVDEALADGIDLLAEMASKVDRDIVRIRRRLSALRGEQCPDEGPDAPGPETRIIRFPADRNCGTLFTRNAGSMDYREWHRIGSARGPKEVYLDRMVRLDIQACDGFDASFLEPLRPDDLQALFLYNGDERILAGIAHLTGLQELYLSDFRFDGKGLELLKPLQGLRRISVYHCNMGDKGLQDLTHLRGLKWFTCSAAGITEEGLARFRRLMPGCRAVSFKWRYEGEQG